MSDYESPAWAGIPVLSNDDSNTKAAASSWQLLEIKGGIQVGQHDLSQRAVTLLGRAEDQVDIALPHESCSRLHARIAFDSITGTPWLRDLGSAHGTTVNRKKLPPQACGRQESATGTEKGSRGVVLYPGDFLQFGASTRLFCLEGPAAFGRGAQQAAVLQKKAATASETPKATVTGEQEAFNETKQMDDESFVSWGMDMDDAPRRNSDAHIDGVLVREQVPQEHLKSFDAIQTLRYKLTNIRKESNSIRRKGDLTIGQERQLQRNEARETELQQKIDEKEEELRRVLGKPSSSSTKEQKRLKSMLNVEEDVEDRTKEARQDAIKLGSEEVATEESLIAEWKIAHSQLLSRMSELALAETKADKLAENLQLLQTKDDEDAFFLKNELQLARDQCTKLQEEKSRLNECLAEIQFLLKVVNPRLVVNKETGFVGSSSAISPKPDRKPPKSSGEMAPPPARIPPEGAQQQDEAPPEGERANIPSRGFMPPPKRKRVMGLSVFPYPGKEPEPQKAVSDIAAQSKSTLGILPAGTLTGVGRIMKKATVSEEFIQPSNRAGVATTNEQKSMAKLGGRVDMWQAPKDQDGSGRSKLNEKFKGRY